jgi:hypothetical protein
MNITVLIEGALIVVVSLVGMAEGLRLIIYKDPYILYDPLGPGLYIIAISIGLLAIAVVHLFGHSKKLPTMERVPVDRKFRIRMISTVAVCALYIFLITIIGYLLATILFFFLGLKELNLGLSLSSFPWSFQCSIIWSLFNIAAWCSRRDFFSTNAPLPCPEGALEL